MPLKQRNQTNPELAQSDFLNECPAYDPGQSDGKASVEVLELWGMQSTPLLSSLAGPLWPEVVAPDRVLSIS